jgi:hypothetical protein
VFISDMRPFMVARTPGISQKISEREIRELSAGEGKKRLDAFNDAEDARNEARMRISDNRQPESSFVAPLETGDPANVANPIEGEEEEDDEEEAPPKPSQAVRRPRQSSGQSATPAATTTTPASNTGTSTSSSEDNEGPNPDR